MFEDFDQIFTKYARNVVIHFMCDVMTRYLWPLVNLQLVSNECKRRNRQQMAPRV